MAKIIKMSSLYFDGCPVFPESELTGQTLSIGDTFRGREILWVQDGSLLVADRCVCTNVSWEQLNQMGLVYGTKVIIDGSPFLCRCLTVGRSMADPNEWDTLLGKHGSDNNLWHWVGQYFWGQEIMHRTRSRSILRGYHSADFWSVSPSENKHMSFGFRPALEPLVSNLSEAFVGSNIKVFGPDGETINGRLTGYDDYNLVLSTEAKSSFGWVTRQGKQFPISRKEIIGIRNPYKCSPVPHPFI